MISGKSMEKAMEKVKELTPRRTHKPLEQSLKEINAWYRGWSSYFKMTQYPAQLHTVEAHIRRRLRARLIRNMKRKRTIAARFREKGVSEGSIKKAVFANNNWWKLSHTTAAHKTFSNEWFAEQGLYIRSDDKLKHWFAVTDWVKIIIGAVYGPVRTVL
jgi:RNA-directed DNA polymerase